MLTEILLALALFASPAKTAEKPLPLPPAQIAIEGWYIVTGELDSGEKYSGMVVIEKIQAGYHLHWLLEGGGRAQGVAIREGDVLSVAASPAIAGRLAISTAESKPKLAGKFLGFNGGEATESFTWLRPLAAQ